MTPPDRPRITGELVDRFAAYYHHTGGEWGSLHIVLADNNYQTEHVHFCLEWAMRHGDREGAALARILVGMSKSQRGRIGSFAELHQFTSLDTFEIQGRGIVHVVGVPPTLQHDPRLLVGSRVRLDRRVARVLGVEAPALPWRPGAFERVSLVVETRAERKQRREQEQVARTEARRLRHVELSVTEDGWLREVGPRFEMRIPPPGHPWHRAGW